MKQIVAHRLSPRLDERARSKIQTSALCNRLNLYALGQPDPTTGRRFEMSEGQIRAALGLLRKTLPDLAVTEHRNEDGQSVTFLHLIAARSFSNGEIQPTLIEGEATNVDTDTNVSTPRDLMEPATE